MEGVVMQGRAITSGALLLSSLVFVLPLAYKLRRSSANTGLAMGLILAAALAALQGLLCLTTSYCIASI